MVATSEYLYRSRAFVNIACLMVVNRIKKEME